MTEDKFKYVIGKDGETDIKAAGIQLKDHDNKPILPRTHKDLVLGLESALEALGTRIDDANKAGQVTISTAEGNVITGVSLSTDANGSKLTFTAGSAYELAHPQTAVTENDTNAVFSKFTVNALGHITGTKAVSTADLEDLVFGTDSNISTEAKTFASLADVASKVKEEVDKVATLAVEYKGGVLTKPTGDEVTNGSMWLWTGTRTDFGTEGAHIWVETNDYILARVATKDGTGEKIITWSVIEKNLDGAVTVDANDEGLISLGTNELIVGIDGTQKVKGAGISLTALQSNYVLLDSNVKTGNIFIGTGNKVIDSGVGLDGLAYGGTLAAGTAPSLAFAYEDEDDKTVVVGNIKLSDKDSYSSFAASTVAAGLMKPEQVEKLDGLTGLANLKATQEVDDDTLVYTQISTSTKAGSETNEVEYTITADLGTNLKNNINSALHTGNIFGDNYSISTGAASGDPAQIVVTADTTNNRNNVSISLATVHSKIGTDAEGINIDTSTDSTAGWGDTGFTVNVPIIDAYGRVTNFGNLHYKMPNQPTDESVKQTIIPAELESGTANTENYPILAGALSLSTSGTGGAYKTTSFTVNAKGEVSATKFTGKIDGTFVDASGAELNATGNQALTVSNGKLSLTSVISEANKVSQALTIGGLGFDGSSAVTVTNGSGITISTTANSATIALATISTSTSAFALEDSKNSGLKFNLPTIEVDTYGRVTLGEAKEFTVAGAVGTIKGYATHPATGDAADFQAWNVGSANTMTFGNGLVISTTGAEAGIVRTALTFEYL